MTEQQIVNIFEEAKAMWFFNRDGYWIQQRHALLTSGLHSDGYINCRKVLSDPFNAEKLARTLIDKLQEVATERTQWVIGSAYAGITFSYEMARQLRCQHGFVKKSLTEPGKMVWEGLTIPYNSKVLQCEELITTLGTANEVRDAVRKGNQYPVRFLSTIPTIIYRPNQFDADKDKDIVALLRRKIKTWEPKDCPLCYAGSKAVRPAQNWAELTNAT